MSKYRSTHCIHSQQYGLLGPFFFADLWKLVDHANIPKCQALELPNRENNVTLLGPHCNIEVTGRCSALDEAGAEAFADGRG